MAILSAALAFAITMLILSMVSSVFVETIHRFVGLRERGLRLMLGHFFDRVIEPYLERQGAVPPDGKVKFLDFMTVNRAPTGAAGRDGTENDTKKDTDTDTRDLTRNSIKLDTNLLSWIWAGRRLAKLDANEFMSRLGSSPYGAVIEKAIGDAGLPDPDEVLKDVAEKFDAFGREASVFFERRARLVSVLVSIAVAWFMYVHPYELFSTFVAKPEIADKVIAMQDDVLKNYEATLTSRIGEADVAHEKAQGDVAAAEKALEDSPEDKTEIEALENAEAAEKAAEDKLNEAVQSADQVGKTLSEAGVPVGWTQERLTAGGFSEWDLGIKIPYPSGPGWPRTVLWLVVGGLLVGLGGPFWYDMVKSLSSIRSVLSGPKSVTNTGEAPADKTEGENGQPLTPVAHFKTGASGRAAREADSGDGDDEEPVG